MQCLKALPKQNTIIDHGYSVVQQKMVQQQSFSEKKSKLGEIIRSKKERQMGTTIFLSLVQIKTKKRWIKVVGAIKSSTSLENSLQIF